MKQLSINSPTAAWIFLLLFALLFWGICMNTPYIVDDYWLNFYIEKAPDGSPHYTSKLISSWNDLLTTWLTRRELLNNGRLSDVMYIICNRAGGIPLFATINTLILIANGYFLSRLCFRRFNLLSIVVCISGVIILIPHLDGTVFWKAGACNYFWPTLPLCVFLLCLEKVMQDGKTISRSILVTGALAGFLCGTFHEGLGAPMVGGLGAFWFFERIKGKKLPVAYWCLLVFAALGTLFTLSAPAMWIRFGKGSSKAMGEWHSYMLACFHFFRYEGLPLIALAFLVWKRKISYHSPMGWILIGLTGLTLVISKVSGDWGGGYYYMGLFVLIFLLKAIAPCCERHSHKVMGFLIPLMSIALIYQYLFMKEANNIYDNTLSAPKENGVCTVDWQGEQKGEIPWILSSALPSHKIDFKYPFCGKLFGQEDFWVYFRHTKIDGHFLTAFEGLDESEAHLRLCDGRYIVRLPKGTRLYSPPQASHDKGKCMNIQQRNTGNSVFLTRMRALFQNRELGFYDEDYHNGFIYLLLPKEITAYQRLELAYKTDIPFGSIPQSQKPGPSKVTLPLP